MPSPDSLQRADLFEQHYYTPIEACCRRIADCITEMHGGDDEQTASLYSTLSKKLIDQTAYFVQTQRQDAEFGTEQATCRDFAKGNWLADLSSVRAGIELTLSQLRAILEPVPHKVIHEDWDKSLRHEIATLDQLLTLLFLQLQPADRNSTEKL